MIASTSPHSPKRSKTDKMTPYVKDKDGMTQLDFDWSTNLAGCCVLTETIRCKQVQQLPAYVPFTELSKVKAYSPTERSCIPCPCVCRTGRSAHAWVMKVAVEVTG